MNAQNFLNKLGRRIAYPFRNLYYNLFWIANLPKVATQKVVNHSQSGYELTANGILIRIQEN